MTKFMTSDTFKQRDEDRYRQPPWQLRLEYSNDQNKKFVGDGFEFSCGDTGFTGFVHGWERKTNFHFKLYHACFNMQITWVFLMQKQFNNRGQLDDVVVHPLTDTILSIFKDPRGDTRTIQQEMYGILKDADPQHCVKHVIPWSSPSSAPCTQDDLTDALLEGIYRVLYDTRVRKDNPYAPRFDELKPAGTWKPPRKELSIEEIDSLDPLAVTPAEKLRLHKDTLSLHSSESAARPTTAEKLRLHKDTLYRIRGVGRGRTSA